MKMTFCRIFCIFFFVDLDQWSPAAVAQAAHGPEIFSVVALSPRFDFARCTSECEMPNEFR